MPGTSPSCRPAARIRRGHLLRSAPIPRASTARPFMSNSTGRWSPSSARTCNRENPGCHARRRGTAAARSGRQRRGGAVGNRYCALRARRIQDNLADKARKLGYQIHKPTHLSERRPHRDRDNPFTNATRMRDRPQLKHVSCGSGRGARPSSRTAMRRARSSYAAIAASKFCPRHAPVALSRQVNTIRSPADMPSVAISAGNRPTPASLVSTSAWVRQSSRV